MLTLTTTLPISVGNTHLQIDMRWRQNPETKIRPPSTQGHLAYLSGDLMGISGQQQSRSRRFILPTFLVYPIIFFFQQLVFFVLHRTGEKWGEGNTMVYLPLEPYHTHFWLTHFSELAPDWLLMKDGLSNQSLNVIRQ